MEVIEILKEIEKRFSADDGFLVECMLNAAMDGLVFRVRHIGDNGKKDSFSCFVSTEFLKNECAPRVVADKLERLCTLYAQKEDKD